MRRAGVSGYLDEWRRLGLVEGDEGYRGRARGLAERARRYRRKGWGPAGPLPALARRRSEALKGDWVGSGTPGKVEPQASGAVMRAGASGVLPSAARLAFRVPVAYGLREEVVDRARISQRYTLHERGKSKRVLVV